MRTLVALIVLSVLGADTAAQDGALAAAVIAEYLKLPMPEGDKFGEFRTQRLRALDRLQQSPDDAVAAIARALPAVKDSRQREELIEALRHFPGRPAADVCITALADEDTKVRGQAIHRLWLLSRKVDKVGQERARRRADAKPIVDGLTPHLIRAADDAAAANRTTCLYALADTLDPAAVDRLRKAIADNDAGVRFIAAALLSEFDDASGLPELKAELGRLRAAKAKNDPMRFLQTGRLLSSFERLTGKSFGKPPMNPMLISDSRKIAKVEAEHDRLLDIWAAWWEWEPAAGKP